MNKGLSLLELLLIIMIVGALAIVALTQYKNMSERARFSEALVIMDQIRKAEWMYYQKSDHFCGSPDCLAMDPSIANSSTGSWGGHGLLFYRRVILPFPQIFLLELQGALPHMQETPNRLFFHLYRGIR
jgi:type II secretory pathway pseudopilin PulG